MASITMTSPVSGTPKLGTQLVARGAFSTPMAAQGGKAPGGVGGTPLTCQILKQSDSSLIAPPPGVVYTSQTSWLARFGPLTNVDGQGNTAYQIVANAPTFTPAEDTSVTVQPLYFDSGVQVAFYPNTPTQFSTQFTVSGTWVRPSGVYTVSCALMSGAVMVKAGSVTVDQPNPGQWSANFNVTGNQSNCWLLAELVCLLPQESVAAAWIDGVSVTN
jgi:hypothetical protein